MTWFLPVYLLFAAHNDDAAIALNQRGLELLEHGRAHEAARTFEQAEAIASSDAALSMILRNEAVALLRSEQNDRAQRVAARALRLAERAAGSADALLTPILNTLAEIAIAGGRLQEASALLDRAMEIGEAAGAHYATAIHNRAAVASLLGNREEARTLYAQALRLRQVLLGNRHAATGATRAALAVLDRQGAIEAARR